MVIGSYISVITLNVNGLNAPTKRCRLVGWVQDKTYIYMLSTTDRPQTYGHLQTESKRTGARTSHKC